VPTLAPDGSPVVLAMRAGLGQYGQPTCELRVLARDRETATAVRDEVERLVREHDVFRGAVLSFDVTEYRGNQMVSFLPRAELDRADVVLPDGVLDAIEEHVVRSAEQTARLAGLGQHLKRGLLLHGPPGTGKTHTVRYLISRLRDSTVVVLSGRALQMLPDATALARRLQPSVLVIEDVDLIAEERNPHIPQPLLFELLNRIDGVDADADVTFVLTTNRVADMERALVDRPGRVDLAVEVPRPDADARERLLRLYARDVPLDLEPGAEVIAATEGVTASFVRELVRRAVLRRLAVDPSAPVRLDSASLLDTLAGLAGEHASLTRALLGGADPPPNR
jgi:ATPase family associated with various cellular activities (AAA)